MFSDCNVYRYVTQLDKLDIVATDSGVAITVAAALILCHEVSGPSTMLLLLLPWILYHDAADSSRPDSMWAQPPLLRQFWPIKSVRLTAMPCHTCFLSHAGCFCSTYSRMRASRTGRCTGRTHSCQHCARWRWVSCRAWFPASPRYPPSHAVALQLTYACLFDNHASGLSG